MAKRKMGRMYHLGEGLDLDLVQAVYWDSELGSETFWAILRNAARVDISLVDAFGCDLSRLAMELGKGLYWYHFETPLWRRRMDIGKKLGTKCLEYYCELIDLQQEAIFLFLLFWNETTGVKGPGQIIGQMVWKGRCDCLVKYFGEEELEEGRD